METEQNLRVRRMEKRHEHECLTQQLVELRDGQTTSNQMTVKKLDFRVVG